MYKTHDYKTLFLAQPSLGCETDLILHYFGSRGHWSHMGWAVRASSVSPGDLPFLQRPGLTRYSVRKFAQSEMCLSFAHKMLLCPRDEFISLLPSCSLAKTMWWIGDVHSSACADALVLIGFGKMISSNYTSFGVAVNSGWCWDLIQWKTLAILTEENWLWDSVSFGEGNIVCLAQCAWLVNLW